jgi:uncharacterized protein
MTLSLAQICRHPIKAHGREDLASVLLEAGACLPNDRRWAVAHQAATLVEGWNPCNNFHRGAKAPGLMAITSVLEGDRITLRHPDLPELSFNPDAPEDLPGFLSWLAPLAPSDRAQPARIVSAGRGMTDSAFTSISVLTMASLEDLGKKLGQTLSPHRFRGNLWIDGAAPFEEFNWIGREVAIGDAVLRVEERITRCKATMANPDNGRIDADTLGMLESAYGHRDFGVYAVVVKGGAIAVSNEVTLR